MRRLVCLLAVVLLVVPSLGSDAPRGWDDAVVADELEGTWDEVTAESGGRARPFAPWRLTFHDGRYTSALPGNVVHGTYKASSGHRLDWLPLDGPDPGRAMKLFFWVEGDTLRMAFISGARALPPAFAGPR